MSIEKRKLSANELVNSGKKQRQKTTAASLLFKPNISKKPEDNSVCVQSMLDDEKSTSDQNNVSLESENNDDQSVHRIPKMSIKRTVNRDSNLSEFKIETRNEKSSSSNDDDDDDDTDEDEEEENNDDEQIGDEIENDADDGYIDEFSSEVEREEEEDDEEEVNEDECFDNNEDPSNNIEASHSIDILQSKQNVLKLKLKSIAGHHDDIIKTIETNLAQNPKRGRPPKIKEQHEISDEQAANVRTKGKRGRKAGYRKYPEGQLKPSKLMSKTPRSITSYFLFSQMNRPKIAEKNPELRLRAIQRIVSEQWNKLTDKERLIWRQKAVKLRKKGSKGMISTGIVPQAQNKPIKKIPIIETTKIIEVKNKQLVKTANIVEEVRNVEEKTVKMLPLPPNLVNFVEDCKPIDIAAYLSVIGESMNKLGNKMLKPKEGLSRETPFCLLDAFLCALGPIFCLTTQIDEMNGCTNETLMKILDNISIIIPS